MATVHYSQQYEDYKEIGWKWQCDCGAHSIKPQPTNKAVVKQGYAHLTRKHGA